MKADKDGVPFRTAMWLGHYASWIIIAGMTGTGALSLYKKLIDPSIDGFVWTLVPYAILAVIVAALLSEMLVHDFNLCQRDLDDAPLTNPQEAVDRHRGLLKSRHTRRGTVVTTVALVVLMACDSWAGDRTDIVAVMASVTALVVAIAMVCRSAYANLIHRRLRAWCPWCRWGGGGGDDDDDPDAPDPTGPAVKVNHRFRTR